MLTATIAHLVEPVGRRLEAVAGRAARRTAWVTATLCVGLAALGFFCAALYLVLLPALGAAGAAASVGGLLAVIGTGIGLLLLRPAAPAPAPPAGRADQVQDLVAIALAVADGFAAGRAARNS